jgi:hypothetical protein
MAGWQGGGEEEAWGGQNATQRLEEGEEMGALEGVRGMFPVN